jgi:hypothetical protein
MRFIRIGDETLRLDLVTHVKEGCVQETYYGRSVRKTADNRYGWVEVHFVSGEVLKIEGEGAEVLRQILEAETEVHEHDPDVAPSRRKHSSHESAGPEPVRPAVPHERAPHAMEEHRGGIRNGFGR